MINTPPVMTNPAPIRIASVGISPKKAQPMMIAKTIDA